MGELSDPCAEQEVIQAVPKFGDHDQHAALVALLLQLPVHAVLLANGRKRRTKLVNSGFVTGRREVDPHEEVALSAITELLVVDDVAAVFQQEAGHSVHDSGTFGTVEGEHVLHGGLWRGIDGCFSLDGSHG